MSAEGVATGRHRDSKKKIFVSYADADRERVDGVKMLWEFDNLDVFMAVRSLPPGIEWEAALHQALADCDILCVFWSAAAQRSNWVRIEYMTFTNKFPDRPCVPLRADATALPPELGMRHAPPEFLHLANKYLALQQDLLKRGVSRGETRRTVRDHLVKDGVQLDETQLRRFLGLFTTGAAGMSLGVLLTSLSKPLKVLLLFACIVSVMALVWRQYSSDHVSVGSNDVTVTSATTSNPGSAIMPRSPSAKKNPALHLDTRITDSSVLCDTKNPEDKRCAAGRSPLKVDVKPTPAADLSSVKLPPPNSADWPLGWVKLGTHEVRGPDRITQGRIEADHRDARFIELALLADNCDLEIFDFEITFSNTEKFHPDTQYIFNSDSHTHIINVPGDERVLASIDLKYKAAPDRRCARIELWGREADDSDAVRAAAACLHTEFKTELVKQACTKGQQAAKVAMKAFMKEKKIKSCNQCHVRLAPKYELKPDGFDQFQKAGGK